MVGLGGSSGKGGTEKTVETLGNVSTPGGGKTNGRGVFQRGDSGEKTRGWAAGGRARALPGPRRGGAGGRSVGKIFVGHPMGPLSGGGVSRGGGVDFKGRDCKSGPITQYGGRGGGGGGGGMGPGKIGRVEKKKTHTKNKRLPGGGGGGTTGGVRGFFFSGGRGGGGPRRGGGGGGEPPGTGTGGFRKT